MNCRPPHVSPVSVARCAYCGGLHLVVSGAHALSIPLSRQQWAELIGSYGDNLAKEKD